MNNKTFFKGRSVFGWKKLLVVLSAVVLLAAGCNTASQQSSRQNNQNNNASGQNSSSSPLGEVKTFTVIAKNYSFSPSEIRVNRGDTVKITLESTDGFHGLVVDEFNARTTRVNGGGTAEIQFTADKTGTFQFYCPVDGHRQMGMVGNLVVE